MAKTMYVRITKKASDAEAALSKHYPNALDRQAIQGVELPWVLGPFKPNVAQELLSSFTGGGGQAELLDGDIATQGAELLNQTLGLGGSSRGGARKKAAKKGGAKRAAGKKPAAKKAGGAKAKKAAGGAKAKKAAGGAKAKKAGGRKTAAKRGKR